MARPLRPIDLQYICTLFVILFSISGVIHLGQAIAYKEWWLLPSAVLACIAEVLGWSARLWSSKNPYLLEPYLIQMATTVIAPTPLVAANFVVLGRIIGRLGSQYSRLNPMACEYDKCTFIRCDAIALTVQAVGGAFASSEVNQHKDPDNGGHIMLGGIVFQMAAICVYSACATEFLIRFYKNKPLRSAGLSTDGLGSRASLVEINLLKLRGALDGKMQAMILGLVLSTIFIFIRSVYRTVELSDGWSGPIISTQVYFNVFDGAMIVLASYTLNALHPGYLLRTTYNPASDEYPLSSRTKAENLDAMLEQ
ncbi:RTA1 like protein [Neolentinus lepideus HHB14362 ss-1]|uniref:RTA1 like protein n=1 Tax=Neolentinus lepideus HHB14362 ss-1 TaxID=1314782 RepID=A0A165UJ80_9AGAM|nr:RTA1 like protein [Neolentinus lepideus HHB14362 ss-1]